MTLQQGLETELMELPGDVATQTAGVDFTAVHPGSGVFTPIPTHTSPIHFYGEISGRSDGRHGSCFKVWRVREWGCLGMWLLT